MIGAAPRADQRAVLTQTTVDEWMNVPFAWGSADCSRLIASHCVRFGHKPKLSRFGAYKSARGALAGLRRNGFETMGEAVASHTSLVEMPAPAFARVGDIIEMPADPDDLIGGAMGIYCGNGTLFGFHPDGGGAGIGACVMQNEVVGMVRGFYV